jgi:hypothetical protein
MWVEGRACKGLVVHFHAVSTLEASLLSILAATSGHMVLFILWARKVPTCYSSHSQLCPMGKHMCKP